MGLTVFAYSLPPNLRQQRLQEAIHRPEGLLHRVVRGTLHPNYSLVRSLVHTYVIDTQPLIHTFRRMLTVLSAWTSSISSISSWCKNFTLFSFSILLPYFDYHPCADCCDSTLVPFGSLSWPTNRISHTLAKDRNHLTLLHLDLHTRPVSSRLPTTSSSHTINSFIHKIKIIKHPLLRPIRSQEHTSNRLHMDSYHAHPTLRSLHTLHTQTRPMFVKFLITLCHFEIS